MKSLLARDTIHLRAVRLPVRRGDDEQRRAQHGHLQLRPEDLPCLRLFLRLLDTQGKEHTQMTSTEGGKAKNEVEWIILYRVTIPNSKSLPFT